MIVLKLQQSFLGREDIDRMMKDAEAHAEDDRKRREAVEMRNEADALAIFHMVTK